MNKLRYVILALALAMLLWQCYLSVWSFYPNKFLKGVKMQTSQVFTNLSKRWAATWKTRRLSSRLVDLAFQFLGYLVITLLIMGVAAGIIHQLVPVVTQSPGIQFLALVYLCCLGIVTAASFDANHIKFLLENLFDEMERIELNTTSPEIYELRKNVEELTLRIGHS
jgi:hypothetical protein